MMADRITVQIRGLKELEATLREMGEQVATKRGRAALRKTANAMRDALIEAAPDDPASAQKHPGRPYGKLRDNIRTESTKARKAHTVIYQVTTGDAFWGNFLEYGTRQMVARPWMRPVFDAKAGGLVDELKNRLAHEIELEAKLQERKRRVKAK